MNINKTTREITKQIGIDMAHRVPNHGSKCKHLHGHRYEIIAHCEGKVITEAGHPAEGMLIDFSDLKKIMMDEIDAKYDHGSCWYKHDPVCNFMTQIENSNLQPKGKVHFVDFIPTAENLAKHWFDLIKPRIKKSFGNDLVLKRLVVWETPSSSASYEED